jgi:hypothetical protein
VDKNFIVLVLKNALDHLGSFEKLIVILLGIGIINVAVLDDVDTVLLVQVHHIVISDFSLIFLNSGHQVDNCGDSVLS